MRGCLAHRSVGQASSLLYSSLHCRVLVELTEQVANQTDIQTGNQESSQPDKETATPKNKYAFTWKQNKVPRQVCGCFSSSHTHASRPSSTPCPLHATSLTKTCPRPTLFSLSKHHYFRVRFSPRWQHRLVLSGFVSVAEERLLSVLLDPLINSILEPSSYTQWCRGRQELQDENWKGRGR